MTAGTSAGEPGRGSAPPAAPRVRRDRGHAQASLPASVPAIEVATLVLATLAVIAAARVAEPFLVPVITGILLSYALRPVVAWLERWRIPRAAAAGVVIVVLGGLTASAGYAIRDDVNGAVAELPGAARKLRIAVAEAARTSPGPMTHVKAAAAELDRAAAEAAGKPPRPPATPSADVAAQFQGMVARQSEQALSVLAQIGVAVLLAFFLLAAGDTFRRKVARLAGASLARRRVTVEVLNQIDAQVQAYLLTLLLSNLLIALATWGALAALGLPNAGMWGAFTGLLHVVPYAGTIVAGAGVGMAMYVHTESLAQAAVGVFAVAGIATLIGIGLTTWLQGRASRMNPVAVFIGVLFFGWLWGGWGLLLGLPVLAVARTICARVDPLHPVAELLGE